MAAFGSIAVLGAGSWGMAIARLLDGNGASVRLWEFDPVEYRKLAEQRAIPEKLPSVTLPEGIKITNDLKEAVEVAELVVLAIPSQSLGKALLPLRDKLPRNTTLVNLAKGIEADSLRRMSEVVCDELGWPADSVLTMSGPSHAEEVARDMPTTVVAAGLDPDRVRGVQELFSSTSFRVYSSDDLVGVELGGSLKNIIAIGVGITDGLGWGDNTRGALITRGLAEITRLGLALGARPETFAGLSGIGDLVTTCISQHSRNRYVGEKIGQGMKLDEVLKSMSMVAEGVQTTRSGYRLAKECRVEMPITQQVHQVLFEGKSPVEAAGDLMERRLKAEMWR
jgi:glycerol-3-phosphate dehydrogenase (NAD(P)+)